MTVRGVGESHEAVKQTDSGSGVDAQAGPEGHPSSSGSPCPPELSCMTLSWVGTPVLAPGTSLSITNSRSSLKLMSLESVMPSSHLILCHSLLPLSIFTSIRVYQMSQLFTSGGQSIGVSPSALVLPMNVQDRFPLEWTGWISLQSMRRSRVFSNTTVQKHQFFGT